MIEFDKKRMTLIFQMAAKVIWNTCFAKRFPYSYQGSFCQKTALFTEGVK
jgi:hypothetical protein